MRRLAPFTLALILPLGSSCGGATPGPREGRASSGASGAATPADDGSPGGAEPAAAPGRAAAPSRHGYAATPLTGWAEALTDVALAALAGRPLPESPVPIETSGGALEPLRSSPEVRAALAGEPEVVGVYLEVELDLERAPAASPDAGAGRGATRTDVLALGLWLDARGLRVAMLRWEPGGGGLPTLPEPPPPVRAAVEHLIDAIRSGAPASSVAFSAPAGGGDAMMRALAASAPDETRLAPVRRALGAHPRVRAWVFDELGVVVRAGGGTYLLGMKITLDDSGLVLEAQPLVHATRTGTRAGG